MIFPTTENFKMNVLTTIKFKYKVARTYLMGCVGGRSCAAMVEAEEYASKALAADSFRVSPFWNYNRK